jgi:hypothetical protein
LRLGVCQLFHALPKTQQDNHGRASMPSKAPKTHLLMSRGRPCVSQVDFIADHRGARVAQ